MSSKCTVTINHHQVSPSYTDLIINQHEPLSTWFFSHYKSETITAINHQARSAKWWTLVLTTLNIPQTLLLPINHCWSLITPSTATKVGVRNFPFRLARGEWMARGHSPAMKMVGGPVSSLAIEVLSNATWFSSINDLTPSKMPGFAG